MFDLSNHEVGDEFVLSPYELGRIISAILAESGSFDYEGNSVIITALPNRKTVKTSPVDKEEVVKKLEIVKEEVVKILETVKEPEAVKEEATPETPKYTTPPKPKGRPRKVEETDTLDGFDLL